MTNEILLAHLSEVGYLYNVEIVSESKLDYGGTFIIANLFFEPETSYKDIMQIPFVYYAADNILFSPCDWLQDNLPQTPKQISAIDWRVDTTEIEAVNAFGLPMLPPWIEDIEKTRIRTDIGRQVKEARTKAGMTVRELADKAGISHSHIVRIEAGRYSITIETLGKICRALGLKIVLT